MFVVAICFIFTKNYERTIQNLRNYHRLNQHLRLNSTFYMRKLLILFLLATTAAFGQAPTNSSTQIAGSTTFTPNGWRYKDSLQVQAYNTTLSKYFQLVTGKQFNSYIGTATQAALDGKAPVSGSANYINNTTSPQTADFDITGSGYIGGLFTPAGSLLLPYASELKFGNTSNGSTVRMFSPGGADEVWFAGSGGLLRFGFASGVTLYDYFNEKYFLKQGDVYSKAEDDAKFFPYIGANQDAVTTYDISARRLSVTGTAGDGYLDLVSQSVRPTYTSGHLKVISDSLNRFSYLTSTRKVTFSVPITGDVTIRMPNLPSPILADSGSVSSGYVHKTGSITETITGLKTFTSDFAATGKAAFGTGYTGGGSTPFSFTESNTSSTGGVVVVQNPSTTGYSSIGFLYSNGSQGLNIGHANSGTPTGDVDYISTSSNLRLEYSGAERFRVNSTQVSMPTAGFSVTNGAYNPTNYERANHYWSGNVYNIGLEKAGTGATRSMKLSIDNGSNLTLNSVIFNYQNYASGAGIVLSRINGTVASPTQVLSGNMLGGLYFNGYTSSGALGANVGAFQFLAAEDFTSSAQGTSFDLSVTAIGSTTRATALSISSSRNVNIPILTASRVTVTDGSKNLASSATTSTELGFVSGVTSAIQTQLNGKQATITFGTGVQTALGVNIGSAGAPVLFNGAAGTPSSMVGTNITGTASGLTAGLVTNGVYTTTFNGLGDARYWKLTGGNTTTGNQANTGLFLNTGGMSIYGGNLVSVFSSTEIGNPSASISSVGFKAALTNDGTNNWTGYGYGKTSRDVGGVVTEQTIPARQATYALTAVSNPASGGIAIFDADFNLISSTGLTNGTTANTQSPGDNSNKVSSTAYADGAVTAGTSLFRMKSYTVSTLPTAGTAGRIAYVTDALAPSFLVTIVGGGAIVTPVFDNGTNWVAY